MTIEAIAYTAQKQKPPTVDEMTLTGKNAQNIWAAMS
jgi:hypothetical protein